MEKVYVLNYEPNETSNSSGGFIWNRELSPILTEFDRLKAYNEFDIDWGELEVTATDLDEITNEVEKYLEENNWLDAKIFWDNKK